MIAEMYCEECHRIEDDPIILVKSDPCARAYVKNILDEVRVALEVKP
ncbi:hypothetical protein C7374_105157 [Falsochrobactrum ovis]|uniref:Uncharacterized protein n=1 Tax=Falsochrobactrum ovis TaxID=1293442 RepID=A0A364JVG6_9HYPH|nr:hypothetical protein C7374_105157 [Falsochrobactrum ovis]